MSGLSGQFDATAAALAALAVDHAVGGAAGAGNLLSATAIGLFNNLSTPAALGKVDSSLTTDQQLAFLRSTQDNSALGHVDSAKAIPVTPIARGIYLITLPDGSKLPDIIANITEEEQHHDTMEITDHPVEYGSSIVDHAFKRPAELTLHLGWSNSPRDGSEVLDPNYVYNTYQKLLTLQESRALFAVVTGKRTYYNMLCQSLMTGSTFKTENSLPITMTCKQIILVNTQTIQIPATTAKNPASNASPLNTGTKTAAPVSSVLGF